MIALSTDYTAWEEQELFLNILHHDSKSGNIIRFEKREDWNKPRHAVRRKERISSLKTSQASNDSYISLNSFKSNRRLNCDVFNYENIAIDIDMHFNFTEEDVSLVKFHLLENINSNKLPTPTMINFTGRGFCVIYSLKNSIPSSSEKAITLLSIVRNKLFERYATVFKNCPCKIDKSVSDGARVIRLPGTINQKNGEFCRLEGIYKDDTGYKYTSLYEIADSLGMNIPKKKKTNIEIKSKRVSTIKTYGLPARLKKINKIIDLRNGNMCGCRENTLFIAYSTAKQIMPVDEAKDYVRDMNNRFTKPLSKKEVESIFPTTDRNINVAGEKGFYIISDQSIVAKLDITEEENKILGFCSLSRSAAREEAKNETKLKKDKRNNMIIALFCDGISYDEISQRVDCSLSTVKRVLKSENLTRNKKVSKIVSVSSVYDSTDTTITKGITIARDYTITRDYYNYNILFYCDTYFYNNNCNYNVFYNYYTHSYKSIYSRKDTSCYDIYSYKKTLSRSKYSCCNIFSCKRISSRSNNPKDKLNNIVSFPSKDPP